MLNVCKPSPTRWFNRVYALVYAIAIFALFFRHCCNLIYTPSFSTIILLIADLVLAFMWTTWQAFFMNPVRRQVFPENLPLVAEERDYPGLDVFICTADPFKEPPVGVVNTALSVLGYEYPTEKLSVYVSDDGGSQLTLFAFMEAAKFARHWLPYCRKYNIMDRSPEVYFGSHQTSLFPETKEIQVMYEKLKTTIQDVVDRGTVDVDQIIDDRTIKSFNKWTPGFTRQQHPTVIEVLLKSDQDKDVSGHYMPNLFYLAREKNKDISHHFKVGALNALIRVSTILTNAPIFLVLDCDMYSNDPKTPLRALCYFMDPNVDPKLAFVQFPQRFHNINKNDTYGAEHLLEIRGCTSGMDGLCGTIFMGTGGFLRRQALLKYQIESHGLWNEPNECGDVLALAHRVASCHYEDNTKWGSEVSDHWFCLYSFLFLGAYGKDFLDYKVAGSPFRKWWNNQRMWLILGCSSYAFSIFDWLLTSIGMSTLEFNVTSKVSDSEITKRYEKEVFEFGVELPLLLPVNIAAIVNLFTFFIGIKQVLINSWRFEELFVQLFIAGFGVVNSWPIYEGMVLRLDKGKMPTKITLKSICIALVICLVFSLAF